MFAKNKKTASIVVVSLLVLAFMVALGFYFSRPQTIAQAGDASLPDAQTSAVKPTEAIVSAQTENRKSLAVTQNDITVQVTSANVVDSGVEIGICYTTPDDAEWRALPDHLFYGSYEIYPDEIEFLANETLADGKSPGTRCALIHYRIDDLTTISTPIKFSISQFYAPGREMYSPCEELQQRLATNSQAQSYGLKANCQDNADGSMSIALVGNSLSISVEEARNALDTIAHAEISGNWEFMVSQIQ